MNREYCHPRALVVERLSRLLGGASTQTLPAFDGERCDRATPADWVSVATSDRLWATERDGDVVLTTTGDGVFAERRRGALSGAARPAVPSSQEEDGGP